MEIFSNRKKIVWMNWLLKCICQLSLRQLKTVIHSCIISPPCIHAQSETTTIGWCTICRWCGETVANCSLHLLMLKCWIPQAMEARTHAWSDGKKSAHFYKERPLKTAAEKKELLPMHTGTGTHRRSAHYPHVSVSHWLSLSGASHSLHPCSRIIKRLFTFMTFCGGCSLDRNMPPLVWLSSARFGHQRYSSQLHPI